MAKKSGKSNNFPVEEAINAAAHFDVSSVDSGVVDMLSGFEAQAKFYSMRAEGNYYKPHQIYNAVYRPKTTFQAPVADKHHMQSSGTITDCAKANPDVFDAEPDYNTYIKILDIEPMPAGTPFIIKYMKAAESEDNDRFGVYSTHEVHDKDEYNMGKTLRTYLCTRIIPRMGRSILRDTASKLGVKTTPVRDANGVLTNVKVVCDECGGYFQRDGRGDYVCINCGLIYQREDKLVAEDMYNNVDDDEDDSEDFLEDGTTQKDLQVGGVLPAAMLALEARLAKKQAAWKATLNAIPADEEAYKARNAEDVARTKRAKQAIAKSKPKSTVKGHTVYEGKWADAKERYLIRQIRQYIHVGVNTPEAILSRINETGSCTKYLFYKTLDVLEAKGQITRVKEEGKKAVKLALTTPLVKATRCPEVIVAPVLLQVQYGAYQKQTINYRQSKVI